MKFTFTVAEDFVRQVRKLGRAGGRFLSPAKPRVVKAGSENRSPATRMDREFLG